MSTLTGADQMGRALERREDGELLWHVPPDRQLQ